MRMTRILTYTLLVAVLASRLVCVAAEAQELMFVANLIPDSITVYSRTASGNTAPLWTLRGPATRLSGPAGPALDLTNNELFVGNSLKGAARINVYRLPAIGDSAPVRTIEGPTTGLVSPLGVALDLTRGEIFVPNGGSSTVTVYSRTASGNTAPLRTIAGPATGLFGPQAVALDLVNNELFVANFNESFITVFSRAADGNVPPLRRLEGIPTGLSGPGGLALDLMHNELFVTNFFSSSVTVYSRTANGSGPPLRVLGGPATGLFGARGLALDLAHDELFVTNFGFVSTIPVSTVTVYGRTQSGNTAPLRTLGGPATELNNSLGLALGFTTGQVPVPTLSEWAWLAMTLVLAGIAVVFLRRRRATEPP